MDHRVSIVVAGTALGVIALGVYAGTRLGLAERREPARCGAGLIAMGPRCCAPGQRLERGRCAGQPASCPTTMERTRSGCVARPRKVRLAEATVHVGPDDWHSTGRRPESTPVPTFVLDAFEVTRARWRPCAEAGACPAMGDGGEPGLPVTGVTPAEAEAFCRFEGGRLPTEREYWRAVRGAEGRRFPWGRTGLVCRRAAFGLVDGPCAHGAGGPEIAGSRPDGASVDGIFDLSGNVAEWTRGGQEPFTARGGSFRSQIAAELGSLGESGTQPRDDIGFRCAYPVSPL